LLKFEPIGMAAEELLPGSLGHLSVAHATCGGPAPGHVAFAERLIAGKAQAKVKTWADALRKAIGGSAGR
jgi:hypothetical protein